MGEVGFWFLVFAVGVLLLSFWLLKKLDVKKTSPSSENMLIINFYEAFTLNTKCLDLDIVESVFNRCVNMGVSIEKLKSVIDKLENNQIDMITKNEYKTLNFYFALLMYRIESIISVTNDAGMSRELVNMALIFEVSNTIKYLNEKYCCKNRDSYYDDAFNMHDTYFGGLLEKNIIFEEMLKYKDNFFENIK